MTPDQKRIHTLLTVLATEERHRLVPATAAQLDAFLTQAAERGVPDQVIAQLADLYRVANEFYYETVFGFFSCDDVILFEWWQEKELWLSLMHFYVIRWSDGKFCLGDASNASFSPEHEYATVVDLIEGCVKEIRTVKEYEDDEAE